MNKKYVIEVATNKASLEKLKSDLSSAIQIPFDEAAQEGRVKGLTRSEKATIKKDLATLFGVADYQADALRKMVQGIIPSDTKGIENMKNQLKDTLGFATGVMQKMQEIGDSTDWMKQGISFIDDFSKMQAGLTETQGVVKGLDKTVKALTKSFDTFKEALAETNADAFLQRFGNSTRSEAESLARANKELEKIAKTRNKALKNVMMSSDDYDYSSFTAEEVKREYKLAIQTIEDANTEIDRLRKKFKGKTQDLYNSKEYQDQIAELVDATQQIKNLPSIAGDEITGGLTASIKEATESIKSARNEIQNLIKDVQGEGIELAVVLPDASAAEFTSKINKFVQNASEQFNKKPIKISLDLLNPFKQRDELTKAQEKNANEAKEVAMRSGADAESLIGLDEPETSSIVSNILKSFESVKRAIKEGQDNITRQTQAWRKAIEKELSLHAKFNNTEVKDEARALMLSLQKMLDENDPLFIDAEIDIDTLIDDIQEALQKISFNIKVDNIDGSGAKVKLGNDKLIYRGNSEVVNSNNKPAPQPRQTQSNTHAVKENSDVISESTKTQTVLKGAIDKLNKSIDANTQKNKQSEENIKKNTDIANKNADKISEYTDKLAETHERSGNVSDVRRTAREKIPVLEQERENMTKSYAGRFKSFNDAVKNNDNTYIENEFNWAIKYLNDQKAENEKHLEEVHSRVDDANKDKNIRYYKNMIDEIDKMLQQKDKQSEFILSVLRYARKNDIEDIEYQISGQRRAIEMQDRQIIGANENIDFYNREISKLKKEKEIERSQRSISKRESESKIQQRRIGNIQSVLDSNQSPVQLVFDEVQEFWKKSYRTIEKTKEELENLKNGKYSDDLKTKLSKLTEEEQKEEISKQITSKTKRIADWEARQKLMSQLGLGTNWKQDENGKLVQTTLEDALKSFTVDSLTEVLKNNTTIVDSLLKNSKLKDLSSIQEIAYYSGVAQDALGFRVQTEGEYVDEKTLQAKLVELARIAAFSNKVNAMFPKGGGTPELKGIEDFISFFEKVAVAPSTIAAIVEQAKTKIGQIEESLVGKSADSTEYKNKQHDISRLQAIINNPLSALDAAKDYLKAYKDFASTIEGDDRFAPDENGNVKSASQMAQVIWDDLGETVKDSVTKAMLSSSEFANTTELKHVNVAGVLEKMTKVFETGALNGINSDDKAYQQLIALLQRQSQFQRARTVTDLQYDGSIKSSLHMAGTIDKPIYVRVAGRHGAEEVYDIHKPKRGHGDTDKSFSSSPHGIGRLLRNMGIEDEMDQIVSALFNDPELAQTLIENLFAKGNIQLSNKKMTKKSSEKYGFDVTPLGRQLKDEDKRKAQKEQLESELAELRSGKHNEELSKKGAEQRLNYLKSQKYSDDKINEEMAKYDPSAYIEATIKAKEKALEEFKEIKLTTEEIVQSLIVLANDIAIDKAKAKNARKSKRVNTWRTENLIADDSDDRAYNKRIDAEKRQAQETASQIRSSTRGTSQHLTSPLQNLANMVAIAREYGLMDTTELDKLLAEYQETYDVARNMPRIKDAGTSAEMADKISAAWNEEENLRNQIIDLYYDSEGSFGTQLAHDRIGVILAAAEREKQEILNGAQKDANGEIIPTDEINAKIAEIEESTKNKITDVITSVIGKSDAMLMAESSYVKKAQHAEKEANDLQDSINKKEKLLNDLLSQHGLTKDALNAENQMFEASNQAARQAQSRATNENYDGGSGGISEYLGAIDTSGLAQESTLRGIYELLNGGAPNGGWDAYDSSNTQPTSAENELDLTVRSFSSKLHDLASGVSKVVKDIGSRDKEHLAILNAKGRVGQYIGGDENEVSGAKIKGFLKRHKDKNLQMALHNHPDGITALSPQDIISAIGIGGQSSIGAFGSIANGKITGVDFSSVSQEIGLAILSEYVKNIQSSEFAELFDDDFDIKPEYANLDGASKQKVSDALNNCLITAITSAKLDASEIFGQVDVSELDDASRKVADAVVEAGAQAAVEQGKLITIPNGEFNSNTAKDLSKEIYSIKGKQDGGFSLAGALNNLHYLGFTSADGYEFKSEDSEKLAKAYSQLQHGMQGAIVEKLDDGVQAYILVLQRQLEAVAEANGLDYAAINKEVEARKANAKNISGTGLTQESYDQVRQYLKDLKETDSSRANEGIKQVYGVLSNGKTELGNADLKELGSGYYRLVETVNHEIFNKLNEQTQQLLIEAKDKAFDILNQYGVKVYGSEDLKGVISDETKDLIAGKRGVKKVGQKLTSMTEPALVRTIEKDGNAQDIILQKAQGQLVAEKAINEAKKEQKKINSEIAQQEEKSEKKTSNAKKQSDEKLNTTSASRVSVPESGNNQGGILGLLGQIAKEETLKSIATLLSKEAKSGGRNSKKSGGRKKKSGGSEAEQDDAAALSKLQEKIRTDYPDFASVGNSRPVLGGHAIDVYQYKNLDAVKAARAEIAKLNSEGKAGTEEWNNAQRNLNALLSEQEKITLKINTSTGEITTRSSFQNLAIGAKAATTELQKVELVMDQLHESGTLSIDPNGEISSNNEAVQKYLDSVRELQTYREGMSQDELFNPNNQKQLSKLALETQNYRKEVVSLLNATSKYNTGETIGVFNNISDNDGEVKQAMRDTIEATSKLSATFGDMKRVEKDGQVVSYQLAYTLKTGKREAQEMTAALNPLTGELKVQKGAVKEVDTAWQKYWKGFKGKVASISQYLLSMVTIHDAFRYLRQGIESVRDIDSALTELKKVTNETDESYAKFINNMARTGSVVGATISDLTKMAAEWARLGYSMEEAGKLAESTAILLNVSEFSDATQASEALISTMQAFQYTADQSQHVVDVLNEVGNNYAVSSDGIATALQDSASALVEGGNNLEQAVALVAAANKVVQDPNSVGSALRTISLRLRGKICALLYSNVQAMYAQT